MTMSLIFSLKKSAVPARHFKARVNHFLRLGLMASQHQKPKTFTVHPRPLGLPAGMSYDNFEELLERLEGPAQVTVLDAKRLNPVPDTNLSRHNL